MWKWFKANFKTIWWVATLVLFSFMTVGIWWPTLKAGKIPSFDTGTAILFLIWIALLFWPIFREINLFGLNLKKEIDSLRSDVREQIVNLRSEIQTSITVRTLSNQQVSVNLNLPPYTAQSPRLPTSKATSPLPAEISGETLKVLSTLWKHQRQYAPLTWRFAVGPQNPNYTIYAKGVGEAMELGLTGFWPEDGLTYLTPAGVEYCKENEDKLLKDWDYQRWQKLDFTLS